MHRCAWVLGLALLLVGCMRPNYQPQYIHVPNQWRFDADEGSTLCNARWWEQFQDPVLNDLIATALRNNQDIKIAISRVFEYYSILGVVNASLYPQINGNASYNRIQNSVAVPLSEGAGIGFGRITNLFEAFLSLNWELDFWGRLHSASEAAYADYLSKIEARRAVVLTIVSSVAKGYINLRGLDAQLVVSKKTLKSREESLKLAKDRFELGETSELEVVQAKAELEIAAIRVLQLERDIPIQEDLLSVLIGENPHDIIRGQTIEDFQYPVNIPAGLPSALIARRPDIVEAEDVLIAANAHVAEARALFFPQFELTGLYGSESATLRKFLTSPAEIWQYGLNVTQIIFDAGRVSSQVDVRKAQRDEALFNYRQIILKAFQEVDDALIASKMNQELMREHQKQVGILKEYVHLATLRYNEGEVDYLNVLDAERSLFDAELSWVQSQVDNFNAVVQLYSALAGGWVYDADAMALSQKLTTKLTADRR